MQAIDLEKLTGPQKGKHKKKDQLSVMQDLVFVETVNPANSPTDRAACVRAWDLLEERKRIWNGRMKAGSINETRKADAGSRKERRRISNAIVLPVQAEVRQLPEVGKESTNPAGVPPETDKTTSPAPESEKP